MSGGPTLARKNCVSRYPATCSRFYILYGGARGGGKTDAGIYWLVKPVREYGNRQLIQHPLYRALVLRRNANDLTDWTDRATRVFAMYGGQIKDRNKQPFFLFPSGAKIYLGHLNDDEAYTKYQGHEYQRMLIEELTQIPNEESYAKLLGSCRSTVPELRPQILCTTNPGGRGHGWVRSRFISVGPPNTFFRSSKTDRPAIYIPSKIDDNPFLMNADPEYVKSMEALRNVNEKLYRAWRHGDWDAFEGQVFTEWRAEHHIYHQLPLPLEDCERVASFDWGYRAPASMHWIARSPENQLGVQHLYVYREVYRTGMTPRQWGQLMARINKEVEPLDYLVLPHDCFSSDQGQLTIAEVFDEEFRKAKQRVPIVRAATLNKGARRSRLGLMHSGLAFSPDQRPYLQIHQSCVNLIRTLPELPYSTTDFEDVDTESEDHAYDSVSCGIMTMMPKFGDAGTAPLGGSMPAPANAEQFKRWNQKTDGNTVPDAILQALATPQAVRLGDAEL